MTESQKEGSSAAQPKKKNPLDLDLDFEKDDFLSSWKSMSVTGDDTMDLDFGPISKGKKKAFNFDKSDMDFNLDDGFGKLPSFNLDIPDIDISSPAKKDGKSKEKSTKESASGKTRGKTDHFDFSFDFNDMDGFNFEPTSKKEDKIAKGGEDKENSLNRMVSPKFKECPAENSDMHQSESRNLPVSDSLRTSKFDLQGCSSESNVNSPSNSANDDVSQRLPPPSVDEETSVRAATSIMKISSSSNQEVNCQLDQLMSPASHSPGIFMANENEPDNSIPSVSRNESSQDTVPEVVQEEASFLDTVAFKLEKSVNKKLIDDNSEISALGGSAVHDTAITEKQQPGKKDLTDNTALVTIKEGAEPVQSGTLVEDSLPAKASRELAHKSQVNVKNQGGVSSTLNSRTTAGALMSEKERETVTRSKYFKQPDKTESQFRSTLNQPTQASVNDREVGTKQLCPPGGSKKHIPAESNSRLTGISSLHSTSVAGKEHAQRLESGREFTTNRPHDEDVIEEKHSAPAKGDKGIKSLHSFRSHVNTPSLDGLAIKSSSKDIANSTSQTMNVEATQNRKTSASAENQLSSVKAIKKMPTISALTASRASGTNLDSLKSPAQKDSMLSRGVQQYKNLSGSTLSKTVEVAVTKKQTLITPSLKRKISEDCTMNMVLKPLKRQSGSPRSSVSMEVSGKVVDNKMACDNPNVAECQKIKNALEKQNSSSPTASNQVIVNELEGPSSLDYDINIEMAEACSKGLDDICNLLSKKHEEAKELLVRAVVNNNRLLMLNHPIYEEKIRMVQKFATQLTLGEVHA